MYGSVYVLINSAEGENLALRIYVSFPQTNISNDKILIVPFPQCLCQLWTPPTDVQHQHDLWRRLSGEQSLLSAEYNWELKSVINASTGKVKPLIMDTLKSGQPPYNGHTVHPLPIIIVHTFLPLKKGQPLNNGQNGRPQCVHYSEVPLYTESLFSMNL